MLLNDLFALKQRLTPPQTPRPRFLRQRDQATVVIVDHYARMPARSIGPAGTRIKYGAWGLCTTKPCKCQGGAACCSAGDGNPVVGRGRCACFGGSSDGIDILAPLPD